MNKSIYTILVLSVAIFATDKTFAQKKNNLTYQTGLFNYFYDKNPTFINLFELKNVSRIRHFTETVLIKSRALSYTRVLNDESNISIIGGRFNGFFGKNELIDDNSKFPIVTNRRWYFMGIEYNRKLIDKSKFKLFYGGGLNYRKGFEYYKVLQFTNIGGWGESFGEGARVQNFGATLNLNMRYDFWKRFFFYSKIDFQGYFHEAQVVKNDFQELNERWSTREFEPSRRINHTLTIGIGVDF